MKKYPNLKYPCEELLEPSRSKYRQLKSIHFYGKKFMCTLSCFIISNFGAIYCRNMRTSVKSRKNHKTRFSDFKIVQGHLDNLDS